VNSWRQGGRSMLLSRTGKTPNEWPERSCLRAAPTMPRRPHPLSPAVSILPAWRDGRVRAAIPQCPQRGLLEPVIICCQSRAKKRCFWGPAALANCEINGFVEAVGVSEPFGCRIPRSRRAISAIGEPKANDADTSQVQARKRRGVAQAGDLPRRRGKVLCRIQHDRRGPHGVPPVGQQQQTSAALFRLAHRQFSGVHAICAARGDRAADPDRASAHAWAGELTCSLGSGMAQGAAGRPDPAAAHRPGRSLGCLRRLGSDPGRTGGLRRANVNPQRLNTAPAVIPSCPATA
jgi:hypothetical protein